MVRTVIGRLMRLPASPWSALIEEMVGGQHQSDESDTGLSE
jgi:hypothetical protein